MVSKKYQRFAFRLKMLTALAIKNVRQDTVKRLEQENLKISYLAFKVIREMGPGTTTLKDISVGLMLAPSSIVSVVEGLVKKGIVGRRPDTSDRRKSLLYLTAKGEKAYSIISSACSEDAIAKGLAKLGDKDAGQIVELFEKLVLNITGDKEQLKSLQKDYVRSGKHGND